MKLRIRGNSVRLRLMKGELKMLEEIERMQDFISFPGGQKFFYTLQIADEYQATSVNNALIVSIPKAEGVQWIHTEMVGLETQLNLPNGDELKLPVEKDFKCLTDRQGEDESDAFPNKTMEVC